MQLLPRMWLVVVCGLLCLSVSQAAGDAYAGTWTGTWEGGGGTGTFELKLEASGGTVTGGVSVGTDAGPYTAKFKSLAFDGNKMTAKYDYPLETQAEIALTATFDGKNAKGTWSLAPQGQDQQVFMTGTWTVEKK